MTGFESMARRCTMLLFRSDPFGGTHELLPCGLLGGDLVKLFRKNNSKYYWYDFTVRGERYRGSTKETNETRALKAAALKLAATIKGSDPLDRKPPTLREYSKDFLQWVETGRLEADSRRYYRNGWRLLEQTKVAGMRMDQITKDEVEKLEFPGSASNGNNALRTLRRMYSKAKEHKMIFEVPDFALFKEHGRALRLNDEAERRLSAVAGQPLKDIIVVMRDTGMRNARELYCMRVENVDFDAGTIFTPDSKTESGRRFIPMSSRVKQILEARCEGRSEGWVWMSRYKGKHIGEGMVYRRWARARQTAGLPRELVLYCARHDFGSFVLTKTGNLKAVMNAMGHGDVRSAMVYQHPEGEIIRNALNARHISRPTVPDDNQANA
jgi:integrase